MNNCVIANIQKEKGKEVEGVLFLISDEQLNTLDNHEGYPDIRKRLSLKVKSYNQIIDAQVYIMTKTLSTNQKPTKKYFDTIYEGYYENDLPIKQMKCDGYNRFNLFKFL